MNTLQSLANWKPVKITQVKRNELAHQERLSYAIERLTECIPLHTGWSGQRNRAIRDEMDHHIHRYQNYVIQGTIKSHYHEKNISLESKDCTFEHVIPRGQIRDLLLLGQVTIVQALNIPTCRISRHNDALLRRARLVKINHNPYLFFHRYLTAMSSSLPEIETYDGKSIDLNTWTLEDHYNYFGIK